MTGTRFRRFQKAPRHCEPPGRANARPMTGSAKQSMSPYKERMDCFAALAMTVEGVFTRHRGWLPVIQLVEVAYRLHDRFEIRARVERVEQLRGVRQQRVRALDGD